MQRKTHRAPTVRPPIDWTPTPADRARDLRQDFLDAFEHVPMSAPVSVGEAYLAAVRRALAAERELGCLVKEEE